LHFASAKTDAPEQIFHMAAISGMVESRSLLAEHIELLATAVGWGIGLSGKMYAGGRDKLTDTTNVACAFGRRSESDRKMDTNSVIASEAKQSTRTHRAGR
jgi:hypothetical protein